MSRVVEFLFVLRKCTTVLLFGLNVTGIHEKTSLKCLTNKPWL